MLGNDLVRNDMIDNDMVRNDMIDNDMVRNVTLRNDNFWPTSRAQQYGPPK